MTAQQSFVFNHIDAELEKEVCILVQHLFLKEMYNIGQRHNEEIEKLEKQIQVQNKVIKIFAGRIKKLENPIE